MEQNELTTSQAPEMGLFSRIIGIFFSPGKTFQDIQRKPNWLVPAIILVVISLGFVYLTKPIILKDAQTQALAQIEKQNLSEDQTEQALARAEKMTSIMIFVGPAVGSFIVFLILAAIWLFISNTILGGNATFSQMLGVTVYKDFIGILAMLVKLPIILAQQTMNIHFSLATFMPDSAQTTFLYKMLSKVEVFNIWIIAVLCIGIGIMSKTGAKKSWPWIVLTFVIWYVATAGLGSMFGQ
jgi:hypothetical protein